MRFNIRFLSAGLILWGYSNLSADAQTSADKFTLFKPVSATYSNQEPIIPEGMKYDILFREEFDLVKKADGTKVPARGSHDFTAYIPINGSSEHGLLYVSHEEHKWNDNLGDGGGGTIFELKKENGTWKTVGDFRHIDFSSVGGTMRNCGGALTPHNTILTAEEIEPKNNAEIFNAIRDMSDFNGMPRYLNYGWVVEVDPMSGKAIKKLYGMGRFEHEDVHCSTDGKTVYLTDDASPAIIYKFVAEKKGDYSKGQLYAYRQSADGESGDWLTLPMQMDSLLNTREVALRRGATMFIRHEWIDEANGKIYISETGNASFNWDEAIAIGGKPAKHFQRLKKEGNNYEDPFGRMLELDIATNKLRVFVEGGISKDSTINFSAPDGLSVLNSGGKSYLAINEDGNSTMWVNKPGVNKKETYNEIFFIDQSIQNATVNDLKMFMAGPRGCETTGGTFTPDGKTYFVSIQHPDTNNAVPFNRSLVVAITGFNQ